MAYLLLLSKRINPAKRIKKIQQVVLQGNPKKGDDYAASIK